MLRLNEYGVIFLERENAMNVRGGDGGIVEYVALLSAAAGAGFLWGYKHLGPTFNKYF